MQTSWYRNNDDSPGRVAISALLRAGARIHAHDPVAEEEARRVPALDLADAPALLQNLQFADKAMNVLQGADALIIVTEWKAYRSIESRYELPSVFLWSKSALLHKSPEHSW